MQTVTSQHPDDQWEINRIDERLSFGLDIGSGANKVLGLGCDVRACTDVRCDMRWLPFRDKTFCIALFRHSLEHIEDWPKALVEAYRVARHVYVILPKKTVWKKDLGHTAPFDLPNAEKIAEYQWGECYSFTQPFRL